MTDPRTGASARLRRVTALACLLLPLLLPACAVPAAPRTAVTIPAASEPAPPEQSSLSRSAEDAELLGTAVQGWQLDPPAFTEEPRGDLSLDEFRRVYVRISAVSTNPATVTFDALQIYPERQAAAEARKDHQPAPDAGVYERDAYRHSQTIAVEASAGVVGQFGAPEGSGYSLPGAAKFSVMAFPEFAALYRAPDNAGLRRAGYWLMFDSDGVRSIVKQYAP